MGRPGDWLEVGHVREGSAPRVLTSNWVATAAIRHEGWLGTWNKKGSFRKTEGRCLWDTPAGTGSRWAEARARRGRGSVAGDRAFEERETGLGVGGGAHGTCTEAASPTKPLSLPTSSNPPDPQTCGGP